MGSSFDSFAMDTFTAGGYSARKQEKAQRAAAGEAKEANKLAVDQAQRAQQDSEAAMAKARKMPDLTSMLTRAQDAQLLGEETLLTKGKRKTLGDMSEGLGA